MANKPSNPTVDLAPFGASRANTGLRIRVVAKVFGLKLGCWLRWAFVVQGVGFDLVCINRSGQNGVFIQLGWAFIQEK